MSKAVRAIAALVSGQSVASGATRRACRDSRDTPFVVRPALRVSHA